jgi:hypothetical protein
LVQSVIAAVIARYAAITMTGVTKPNIWFDGVPQTDAGGLTQELPYVNLVDEGTTPEFDFEYNPIETTRFRLEVWANTLTTVDLLLIGLKYGSTGATAGGGYDFATFTITGQQEMECRRTEERRSQAPQVDAEGKQAYMGTLNYEVQAKVN